MAVVCIEAGESAIRWEGLAEMIDRTPLNLLWSAINQEAKYLTKEMPYFETQHFRDNTQFDIDAFSRPAEIWVGTLIRIGIEILRTKAGVRKWAERNGLQGLAKAAMAA